MANIIAGARAAAKAYIENNKAGTQAAGALAAHQIVAEEEDFVYQQVGESVAESAKAAAEAQAKAKLEAVQEEYSAAAGAHGGAVSATPAVRKRKGAEISPEERTAMAKRSAATAEELATAAQGMGLAADVDEAGGEGVDAAGRRVRGRSAERDF